MNSPMRASVSIGIAKPSDWWGHSLKLWAIVLFTLAILPTIAFGQQTITASSGSGGAVIPAGSVSVASGGNQTFAVVPSVGCVVADVVVDGVNMGALTSYTFTNVTANHSISATFQSIGRNIPRTDQLLFSISTDALPASGAITSWPSYLPAGQTLSKQGSPDVQTTNDVKWEQNQYSRGDGFNLGTYSAPITVDGVSIVTAIKPNRNGSHTPWTSIVDIFYNHLVLGIRNDTGEVLVYFNGTLTATGVIIPDGQATVLSLVVPVSGALKLSVNGRVTNLGVNTTGYTALTPGAISYQQSINVGRNDVDGWTAFNGNIGDVFVYKVALTDAERQELESELAVKFKASLSTHSITATSGIGGSISPNETVAVNSGADQVFTITPDSGYAVADVMVDGVSVGALTSYTFANVTANHSISAIFNQTITIDTVPIRNAGNVADPLTGFGSVGYNYNIGKYEVTAGQYTAFLNAVAKTDTYGLYSINMDTEGNPLGCNIKRTGVSGNYGYSVAPDWANRPVNFVSYWDSCRFANWISNGQSTGLQDATTTERCAYTLDGYNGNDGRNIVRNAQATWVVTSENEWYKAAYYKGSGVYSIYANGTSVAPGVETDSNYGGSDGVYSSPWDGSTHGTLEQNGTKDMMGNVWEWNEGIILYDLWRGLRGGSVYYGYTELRSEAGYNCDQPTGEDGLTGFRVCEIQAGSETSAITATSGTGGAISPLGTVTVNSGADQLFTITPNSGYVIADVLVDDVSVGAVTSYTFTNVVANHTITASFKLQTRKWDVTADFSINNGNPNGVWSYGWAPVDFSTFNLFLKTTSNSNGNYWLGELAGDGNPSAFQNTGSPINGIPTGWISLHPGPGTQPSIARWTAPIGLSKNVTIAGQFLPGDGGTMQVAVRKNNTEHWQAVDSGAFNLTSVVVPGDTIDFAVYGGYGSGNTPLEATITADFDGYSITASAGLDGSISPSGLVLVSSGGTQIFNITPGDGYHVEDVLVDGVSVGAVTDYTFANVIANHTISATFDCPPGQIFTDYTDAISREVTLYTDPTPPDVYTDAISREVTLYTDPTSPDVYTDAISREVTLYTDPTSPDVYTDAISRELTIFNSTPPDTHITESPVGGVVSSMPVVIKWMGDVGGTTAGLQYSWRLNGAAWSPWSADTQVSLDGLQDRLNCIFEVKALDVYGQEDASPASCIFDVSLTAPVISNVASVPLATTAVITWTTDILANSQVEYGSDTNYGVITPVDPNMVLHHSVTIQGLTAGSTYHYRVRSTDRSGRESISDDFAFITGWQPDLVVDDSIVSPVEANNGSTINVSWTVSNAGAVTANGPWVDRVYLSTDDQLSLGDTQIGLDTTFNGSLAAGAGYSQSATITGDLSFRIPGGDYWLIVVTDIGNGVFEINESNNLRAKPIHINLLPQPDLEPSALSGPVSAIAGSQQHFTFNVTNNDAATLATSTWFDAVYFSKSAIFDSSATRIGISTKTGVVNESGSYAVDILCSLPETDPSAEPYYLFASTDCTDALYESNEINNVSPALPIIVVAGVPDLQVASVTAVNSAAPRGSIKIDWSVLNKGTGRPIGKWTDAVYLSTDDVLDASDTLMGVSVSHPDVVSVGQVYKDSLDIELDGRAPGDYYILVVADSAHALPDSELTDNVKAVPLQITRIQSLIAAPDVIDLTIKEGATATASIDLTNLADIDFTGITAIAENLPANLEAGLTVNSATLMPLAKGKVDILVTAKDASALNGGFDIKIAANPDVHASARVNVTIVPNKPLLVSTPGNLAQTMLRGTETLVEFSVENKGSVRALGLKVEIPDGVSWLNLVTPAELGNIEPGQKVSVVLSLKPTANLMLGDYTGTLLVAGSNGWVEVPFAFRSVSDGLGNLTVSAVDEYTYFAEDKPKVAGAKITLTDPSDANVKLQGVTDITGEFTFSSIKAGMYNVLVEAENHTSYKGVTEVKAGETNGLAKAAASVMTTMQLADAAPEQDKFIAFLSRQLVKYIWTVVPTEIQDKYDITLQATFETHVPAPVVTVDPPMIDVQKLDYDATGKAVVDLTITNHGLVGVHGGNLSFGSNSNYRITPIVENVGELAACSSVVVPVEVQKLGAAQAGDAVAQGLPSQVTYASGDDCRLQGVLNFYFICDYRIISLRRDIPVNIPLPGFMCIDNPLSHSPIPSGPAWPDGPIVNRPGPPAKGLPVVCDDLLECAMSWVISKGAGDPTGCINDLAQAVAECGIECHAHKNPRCQEICIAKYISSGLGCIPDPGAQFGSFVACLVARGYIHLGEEEMGHQSLTSNVLPDFSGNLGASKAYLAEQVRRVNTFRVLALAFYDDSKWIEWPESDRSVFEGWMTVMLSAMDEESTANTRIALSEAEQILSMPRPSNVSALDAQKLIDRWNRTCDYYDREIYSAADVPLGQSKDFVDDSVWQARVLSLKTAAESSKAEGYDRPMDGLNNAVGLYFQAAAKSDDGVCARVKIQIDQQAVVTRNAFKATLEVENSPQNVNLENVIVDLDVRNAANEKVNGVFGIGLPELTNVSDVSGSGVILPGTTARSLWTIIPTRDAAPTEATVYTVGGTLSYTQDERQITVPLYPTPITVMPDPLLELDYFLVRDVYSDDPFTTQVEPSEAFSLGLLVRNKGYGAAKDFRIISAQPKIVENDKGLLIDFNIVATKVNDLVTSPSLTADFGELGANSTAVAQWIMKSSLQGKFISYSASYEHVDGMGVEKLSLIDKVNIHELNHVVRVVAPSDDNKPDFLANDTPTAMEYQNPDHLPNTLYNSDGSISPVTAVVDGVISGTLSPGGKVVHLTANTPGGYVYIRTEDPGMELYDLVKVVRDSDSKEIMVGDNAWTTHRTIRLSGQPVRREHRLHIFDRDSSGSYTLYYEPISILHPGSIAASKQLADGKQIVLGNGSPGGVVVTASFPDCIYVEDSSRTAGIRVINVSAQVGQKVRINGILATDPANGERYLGGQSIEVTYVDPMYIEPLAMSNNTIGGGNFHFDSILNTGQRGVGGWSWIKQPDHTLIGVPKAAEGLNNVGLLIKTWGKVLKTGPGYFYIDDGSDMTSGSIFRGLQVKCGSVAPPASGSYVAVTGLVSIRKTGEKYYAIVRIRSALDVLTFDDGILPFGNGGWLYAFGGASDYLFPYALSACTLTGGDDIETATQIRTGFAGNVVLSMR